jgi:Asp-tRNA(Asn)/Glu-tRNA(Gln) amidotransferase A subunit family amidase
MENLTTAQIEMELKRRKNEVKKLPKKSGKEVRKFDEFVNYIDDEGSEYKKDVKTLLEKDWKKLEDFAKKNNMCPALLNMGIDYMSYFEETLDEIRSNLMNKEEDDYNNDIFDEETRRKDFEKKIKKRGEKGGEMDFNMLYDKVKINFVKKNKYIMW